MASIVTLALLVLTTLGAVASGTTVYVPDDYPTIQAAVNAAASKDMIIIRDGTYAENVDVTKSLTIRSENGSTLTIIKAKDPNDHVFFVTSDYVNISGLKVTGSISKNQKHSSGIYIGNGAGNCNISDIDASNNDYGILLVNSNNNTLKNNLANSNTWDGILLHSSGNNTLKNNIVSNNWRGIYLEYSPKNNLKNNTILKNHYNFGVWGGSWTLGLLDYTQDIDTSNTVDKKPIYYWINTKNKEIPKDAGYVGIVNSSGITVKNLSLKNNSHGVLFAYTSNSIIENVNASCNLFGIYLHASNNNTVKENIANSNFNYGILLGSSNNNTIVKNTANSNQNHAGIYLFSSDKNTLFRNTVKSNNIRGIYISGSDNTLTKNIASKNSYGVYFSGSENNTFEKNTVNSNHLGICLYSSSKNKITCNKVSKNDKSGFFLFGGSTNNNISFNNIISNSEYNFYNRQSDDVDATENFWGGRRKSSIKLGVYDWDDDSSVGNVTFLPKLDNEALCAPFAELESEKRFWWDAFSMGENG